ncbi:MAG TPA: hypothetical protein VGK73_02680 [Polyangiaceae bacterium]
MTLILSAVFTAAPAFAQVEQHGSRAERETRYDVEVTETDGSSYTAIFKDDLLSSLVNSGEFPRIKVRPAGGASRLIRPRTHFVRELLKSVEQI